MSEHTSLKETGMNRDIKKQRPTNELDIMKFICILLVVLGHITFILTGRGAINIKVINPIFYKLTGIIYLFHMPAFIAISGMVYYITSTKLQKYSNFKFFIKNKISRLLVPYIFFATFWVYPTLLIMGKENFSSLPFSFFKNYILCLDNNSSLKFQYMA